MSRSPYVVLFAPRDGSVHSSVGRLVGPGQPLRGKRSSVAVRCSSARPFSPVRGYYCNRQLLERRVMCVWKPFVGLFRIAVVNRTFFYFLLLSYLFSHFIFFLSLFLLLLSSYFTRKVVGDRAILPKGFNSKSS